MSRAHVVPLVLVLGSLVALAACKSTEVKDRPETLAALEACKEQSAKLADKDRLIQTYEAELARLKLESGNQELTLVIQGDALVIKSRPQGGGAPAIDDAVAQALSRDYIALVNGSRGAIQKCYEQALKKNTALQARTISMTVSSTFQGSGAHVRSSFQPALGEAFDACMKSVASRWKLSAAPQTMTFQATVSLSPS